MHVAMGHRLACDLAVIDPNVESGHRPVRVARQRSPLAHEFVVINIERPLVGRHTAQFAPEARGLERLVALPARDDAQSRPTMLPD